MRCPQCKKHYLPKKDDFRCPHCGYGPNRWQRWWSVKNRRVVIPWTLVTLVLPLLAILTGQVIIVGMLLSFILGGYMVIAGIKSKFNNLKSPGLARGLTIAFGSVFIFAAVGLLVWLFTGAPVPGWGQMRPIFSGEEFIGIAIVVLFSVFSRFVKRGMDWLLRRRLRKEQPEVRIFFIPPFFTGAMLMCILLLLPIEILLPIAWLNGDNTQVSMGLGLGLPLIMLPILLFAVLMVRHNFGAVSVDSRKITRYYFLGRKTLSHQQVTRIKVKAFGLPPAVVIKGQKKAIRFPRAVQGYPELLDIIQAYTGLSLQKSSKKAFGEGRERISFPYTIEIPLWRCLLEIIALILLILIYLAMALAGLWVPLLQGSIPPFTNDDFLTIALVFGLVSLVFVPAIIVGAIQSFGRRQPIRIVLSEGEIKITTSLGHVETYSAEKIKKVWLAPVPVRARARYGGVLVKSSTTDYELRVSFTDQPEIVFKSARLRMLGVSPENLLEIFNELYSL